MRQFWILCIFMICSASQVVAVSVTILSVPNTISEDKFSLSVETEGATAGTNYLRVDLFKEGTKNYFGETDNGQYWYGGSDAKQYFPITIETGVSNIATFSARLGEPTIGDYPGPGTYKLRIRRYTSSGGQGSEDPSPVSVEITKVLPTPTPSPSPTPTPQPSPTQTPTPTPKPSPTPSPSLKPPTSLSPSISPLASISTGTVAGESTEIDLSSFGISPTPISSDLPGDSRKVPQLNRSRAKTAILVGSGLLTLSVAGYFGYRKYLKHKSLTDL